METSMTISVGDRLPQARFKIMSDDGPAEMTTDELFSGKTVVLFGVPGAFTPTCSASHLPGYIENHAEILSKGVDQIAVVSVNDVFVMNAWAEASGAKGKILFLADGSADFTKAVGLDADLSLGGMGIRSQRYSMIAEDGVVKALNMGDRRGEAIVSGAAAILEQL
jgi:peroxiredoxin